MGVRVPPLALLAAYAQRPGLPRAIAQGVTSGGVPDAPYKPSPPTVSFRSDIGARQRAEPSDSATAFSHHMDIQITTKKSEGVERLLEVSVPLETVRDQEEKTARRYASSVRLPGFRPGKAPP